MAPLDRLSILEGISIYESIQRIQKGAPTPSPTDMSADPDTVSFGVIICATVPVLLLLLYMSVFGRRMGYTAIRWHVINCSVWGLLHLATVSSYAEKAPFPNWINDQEWSDRRIQVECLTRSIFPAGMFFIYIERMLLTCSPKLENNRVFNAFFAFFLLLLINGLVVFCFSAMYMSVEWFYNPIELFNLVTYVLFIQMTIVYFIFCLFGSCCCCFNFRSKGKSNRKLSTFNEMWLLFPYALIPNIMYGPSFAVTSIAFGMKVLMKLMSRMGLLEKFMGGGGSADGTFGPFTIQMMMDLMKGAMEALPWFVMLFPLVQCLLALLCVTQYREQFFFLISCGRFYHGKKEKQMWLKTPTLRPKTADPTMAAIPGCTSKKEDVLEVD